MSGPNAESVQHRRVSDPFNYYVHKERGAFAVAVRDSYGKWSVLTESGGHGYYEDDSFWNVYVSVDVCFTAVAQNDGSEALA